MFHVIGAVLGVFIIGVFIGAVIETASTAVALCNGAWSFSILTFVVGRTTTSANGQQKKITAVSCVEEKMKEQEIVGSESIVGR